MSWQAPAGAAPRQGVEVFHAQLWFTAVRIAPAYLGLVALFALVAVRITLTAAREWGLDAIAVELVLRLYALELMPVLAALLVALRSGSAIAAELALMRATGELAELARAGARLQRSEYLPRVVATVVAVVALSLASAGVCFVAIYALAFGASPHGAAEFGHAVATVFSPAALIGFVLKGALFGIATGAVAVKAGLGADARLRSVPVAVRAAMVRLFFLLAAIEIAALALAYV